MAGPRDIAITLRTIMGAAFTAPLNQAKAELKTFGSEVASTFTQMERGATKAPAALGGMFAGAASEAKSFGSVVGGTFEQIEQRSERLKNVWKSMFEAFIGVAVLDQLKRIAEAADTAAAALETASRITANLGHGSTDYVESMDTWLRRLAASADGGGYSLTQMRRALQDLSATGASPDQQKRMLVDVIGLSAARTQKELAEATHIAMMAAEGHIELLSRYGIQVKKANGHLMSFSEVMANWEKLVAGAAEERAKGLEGAFGRLGNALNNLATGAAGKTLAVMFTGAANAATHLVDAVAKLPPWLVAAAAAITFTTLSLTALGLMLPAVKLAFEFLGTGAQIAWAALMLGPKAISFVIAGLRDLVVWLGLMRTAFLEGALAEWASMAPMLAIIGAIALVTGAIILLAKNWDATTKYMGTAWEEFVNGVLRKGDRLKQFLEGVTRSTVGMLTANPFMMAAGTKEMGDVMHAGMPKTSHSTFQALKDGLADVKAYAEKMWKGVVDFFGAQLGKVAFPKAPWDGLGGPSKPGKVDQKGINDWLTAMLAAVDAMLARVRQHVEEAKARLEATTAALAALRDKRDPFKPLTVDGPLGVAAEQKLERDELERTIALRRAVANQRDAELKAAEAERQIMAQLPAADKERVKHHAELQKRVDEHVLGAIKLNGEFAKLGGTVAKVARDIAHAFDALTLQQLDLSFIGREGAASLDRVRIQGEKETDRSQFARRSVSGAHPLDADREDVRQAVFDRALAKIQQNLAQQKYYEDVARAKTMEPVAGARLVQQAEDALRQAGLTWAAANDKVGEGLTRLRKDLDDTHFSLSAFVKGLVDKLGIPGLSIAQKPGGGVSFGAFNWTSFLLDAASKTKAFADVQKVATEIMQVFAQVLDALRPVIDLVLKAVAAVANVFISLYNVVARILRVFGIHVALLDKINTDFTSLDQNARPFISLVHDIPTLNELATGKIGTLSTTPTNYTNFAQIQAPTIDALKSEDLGGGIFGVLKDILGGILAIKIATALFGGGGIAGFFSRLFSVGGGGGSGGGLVGFVKGLFGIGGGSSGGSLLDTVPGFNSLNATMGGAGGGASLFGSGTFATALASYGAGIIGALGLGGLAAKLTGGNSANGAIGGLLGAGGMFGLMGGAGGLAFLGPAGWALLAGGALLGGFAGGLFGPHWGPESNYPDRGPNAGAYQAFLAAFNSGPGGQGDKLETELRGVDPKTLTGQALADYNQLMGLENGSGQLGIKGEKDGLFSFIGGTTDTVVDFMTLAGRALSEFGQAVAGALSGLASQAQDITRLVNAMGNELTGQITANSAAATAAVGGAVASSRAARNVAINLDVTHTGDINNVADVEELGAGHYAAAERAMGSRGYSLNRAWSPA